MSIGNLKDSGNQGNNLPWQWKVLQGLQAILDETSLPLTCAEDSIKICDANGDILGVNSDGSIDVSVIKAVGIYPEDNSHTTGDRGSFILAVRNDSNTAMTSANGDYSPVAVNANGAVAINDGGNSITVDGTVTAVQATASNLNATVVGGTGPQRIATFLRPSGSNGTVGPNIYSASFASVGTANAIVGGINLKPGETLNFDAGAINNTLAAITYNTLTNAGAELIIITLT